ncbi:MAG: transglycosylase SLT domain-containing protein, partial [Sandaracinaceae bacterium]
GLLAAALAAACSAPSPNAPARPPAPAPPPPAPEAPRFDPDEVRPEGTVADVLHLLRAGDPEPERALAVADAADASDPGEPGRLLWVKAAAAQAAGHPVRAAEALAALIGTDHPLAPWARLWRGRLLREADPGRAATELQPLTTEAWAGQDRARRLLAATLVDAGRLEDAEPTLRALLQGTREDRAAADVVLPLARLLIQRNRSGDLAEAARLLQRVPSRAPRSADAEVAQALLDEVLAALPAAERAALAEPSLEDRLARAEAFMGLRRYEDAEQAFREVVEAARRRARATSRPRTPDGVERPPPDALCRARFGEAKATYHRRERARAADRMAEVAEDCTSDLDRRAWALFYGGRAATFAGDHERALALYARLEEVAPTHRLADDARFRGALLLREAGDEEGFRARLASLPERYPDGDMRGRARFRLAWEARRRGASEETLRYLEASLAEGPEEDAEGLQGRAAYWRAVTLADLGRVDDARDAWRTLIEERPLAYYAQQAVARLREHGDRREAPFGEPGPASLPFAWRDELATAAFARARELLRVGATEEGATELRWVARHGTSDRELRWLRAAMLDRAGDHVRAVYLARGQLGALQAEGPDGDVTARWRVAYPLAYRPLIEDAARAQSLPAALVRAIAREESGFRPDAVSVAHAYGLVQLILPTARRFGRRVGIRPTARTLTDPGVNVRVGAAFMAWLWDRYEEAPALVPPAYNAGQGAVDRWLDERGGLRFDAWVEEIPYDETRRYTRRVLQTWGTYQWLATGELPAFPGRLSP